MKTIPEVLAEIDASLESIRQAYIMFPNAEPDSLSDIEEELLELKEFILSGECEHEWSLDSRYTAGPGIQICLKCGVTR